MQWRFSSPMSGPMPVKHTPVGPAPTLFLCLHHPFPLTSMLGWSGRSRLGKSSSCPLVVPLVLPPLLVMKTVPAFPPIPALVIGRGHCPVKMKASTLAAGTAQGICWQMLLPDLLFFIFEVSVVVVSSSVFVLNIFFLQVLVVEVAVAVFF